MRDHNEETLAASENHSNTTLYVLDGVAVTETEWASVLWADRY